MTTTALVSESGIFREASPQLLEELKLKNQNEAITFLLPTKYISEESARLGLLLNHICNQRRKEKTIHRTFFASCHWEAISGTAKLMRHHHWNKTRSKTNKILIYDPYNQLKEVFNPIFNNDESKLLVPGLQFETSFERIKSLLNGTEAYIGFICCWDGILPMEEIEKLFVLCKEKNIFTALDEAGLEDWYLERTRHQFLNPPDVFIFGENLANREIPFACFTMTKAMYEPWNNITNCLTHSSSYSGNTISISMVLALFEKNGLTGPDKGVSKSKKAKYKAYATYVNPSIAWIFYGTELSPEVLRAKGSWISLKDGKGKILDGIAGSGCCLRGHNPSDIVEDVLECHDPKYDYWEELSQKFSELSKLPFVFPAVSGSSAVDLGIILSLLAQKGRRKIITFSHNYSGKSLISINVTRFEYFRAPFYPLYDDILEIDPFQEGADEILRKELLSGEVALLWFEFLQGQNLDKIPPKIVQIINENQKKGGYLIGIDEILTGMFRTGNFLASDGEILNPDIIALAKGVSDMTFPIATVLVSEKVYQKARAENPELVDKLKTHFINQIGAHIALHGLKEALKADLANHVKAMGKQFKEGIKECVKNSPFHKDILGEGLLLYIKLNKKAFPINVLQEEFVEFLMSSLYLNKGRILFLNSRLTPSLMMTQQEIDWFSKKIAFTLSQMKPFPLFLFCLKKILYIHFLCLFQKLREKFYK